MNKIIKISGAKNSALPIIASTVLANGIYILYNIPDITDVDEQVNLLRQLNVRIKKYPNNKILIDTTNINRNNNFVYDKKIRGSYYFMGSLIPFKIKKIYEYPGGCQIGARPINYHTNFFEFIGAKIHSYDNKIEIDSRQLIKKNIIYTFEKPSIGATINGILSTVINYDFEIKLCNVAKDPYIIDLCNFLRKMGAKINGEGTNEIIVNSVSHLYPTDYEIFPDPIEAGSYIIFSSILTKIYNFKIIIGPIILDHLGSFYNIINNVGISLRNIEDFINSYYEVVVNTELNNFEITTDVFPGLYTDLHPFLALLANYCNGQSKITDKIMDNRFLYVNELKKLGYDIQKSNNTITINPVTIHQQNYNNIILNIPDLRSGMVILFASIINKLNKIKYVNFDIINRGYEHIENKLNFMI